VTVKIRYSDFRTLTRSRTAAAPVATKAALVGTVIELVRGVFPLRQKIRLLGVTVSGFEAGGERMLENQGAFDFGGRIEGEPLKLRAEWPGAVTRRCPGRVATGNRPLQQ
jgi:hypothetical protein